MDVFVRDVGIGPPELRANVDAAYHTKYGLSGHQSMVTDGGRGDHLAAGPTVIRGDTKGFLGNARPGGTTQGKPS